MSARKIVAIHQPNYLPWLGYFHKIAAADIFVFLDDVPFSKGSYINRVKTFEVVGFGSYLISLLLFLSNYLEKIRHQIIF